MPAGQESLIDATPFLTVAVLAMVACPRPEPDGRLRRGGTVDGLDLGRDAVDGVVAVESLPRRRGEVGAVARSTCRRRRRRRRSAVAPRRMSLPAPPSTSTRERHAGRVVSVSSPPSVLSSKSSTVADAEVELAALVRS